MAPTVPDVGHGDPMMQAFEPPAQALGEHRVVGELLTLHGGSSPRGSQATGLLG